ncbi:hypothetical protein [Oceanospirillum beijerinckii]|uniref:hypothetical protein n=1 Tax=Oceanospirillum beijerinckii TaxID=64976 RepID=UPI000413226C|nr:hypothetical protein [Oceanospirillum beijerinckii]MAC47186.1 hypothetical protein [Oceanospirillum sp.]
MIGINSAYNDTYLSQSRSQKLDAAAHEVMSTTGVAKDTTQTAQSEIQLSSRAVKIQKLNEEFFKEGADNFTISSQFVSRLTEYGLISQVDADMLNPLTHQKEDEPEEDGTPLNELKAFIKDFSEDLEEGTNSRLLDTLTKSVQVLDNYDGSQPNPLGVNARQLAFSLHQFNGSETAESLANKEKEALKKLELAMRLAERLNPQTVTAGRMNSYLDTLSRFA